MKRWAIPGLLLLSGCQGDDPREIPMWQDGVLVQGDCPAEESIAAVDSVGLTQTLWRDFLPIPFEDPLPTEYGAVARDLNTFNELMETVALVTSAPPDFNTDQVGFVWARDRESCGYTFEEVHVLSKQGGGSILEVTLTDPALGCDQPCAGGKGQFLVVQSFPNDEPGSICLKIKPGCPP